MKTYKKAENILLNDKTVSQDDIENNKIVTLFSYLSVLMLIPLFTVPNSKFARFHIVQGINLLILEIIYTIVSCLIKSTISQSYSVEILTGLVILLSVIINAALGVFITFLSMIGIINVINGRMKPLPLIGKIKIVK